MEKTILREDVPMEINIVTDMIPEHARVTSLRLSKFIGEYIRGDIVALHHSLTHQVVYMGKKDINSLQEVLGNEIQVFDGEVIPYIEELKKKGFLVSADYKEEEALAQIRNGTLGRPAFGILYLLLTDVCNINCRYCFIEQAMPTNREFIIMTKETAFKALKFFAESLKKNPEDLKFDRPGILFYGGEPLVNKEVFIAAANEVTRMKQSGELPENTRLSMVTNGTIMDQEIMDAIISNNVIVAVSLDGDKDLQDKNRVYRNQMGTYDKVYKTIKMLQGAEIKIGFSCTISHGNVDHLKEVLEWFSKEFHIKGLGFNILMDLPGQIQADPEYVKRVNQQLIDCYKFARENGIYEGRIMRKIKSFVEKTLHLNDCGACGNQLVITPKGEIGHCHGYLSKDKPYPGHLDDLNFDPFTDPTFLEWSRRSPFNIPECYYCNAIGLCGGGCPRNSDLRTGSIWTLDQNFCYHSKTILEWMIWDLYEQTQKK